MFVSVVIFICWACERQASIFLSARLD